MSNPVAIYAVGFVSGAVASYLSYRVWQEWDYRRWLREDREATRRSREYNAKIRNGELQR